MGTRATGPWLYASDAGRGFQLVDPDRSRLELGRAGLGVDRVDRQEVRRDVVLEVEGHEREARPERLVDPDRRLDLAAARRDTDELAVGEAQPRRVLRRDVERLAASQRRRVAAGLDAGVVRVEAAAGRQADREVVIELVDRRVVLDREERRPVARYRIFPEPAVEEELTGVVLVVARPLEPAQLLEPPVGHPGVDWREAPDLVPDVLRRGRPPVVAHPPGELVYDPEVVAGLAGRVERLADTLDAPLRV